MTQTSPWSEPVVARLKSLVSEGHSYGQAAKILSGEFGITISRNAVCAKVDRIGDATAIRPAKPALRAPAVARDASFARSNMEIRADREEAPRGSTPPDSIATAPKSIAHPDFCRTACKWPIMARNAEGDIQLCQEPSGGATYCAEHNRYAHAATMPKSARKLEAEISAINRKIGAQTQANRLVFSPRAA